MAMQLQQAQIELAQARARADDGLGAERYSRIDENRALAIANLHKANASDEAALLDKIKAIKELESMDLNHIQQLLAMASGLRAQESNVAETSVGELSDISSPIASQASAQ